VHVRRILLLFLLAASAACDRNPETLKLRYVRSGDAYLAKKQYPAAILEYRRAVQIDPKFGQARFKLAEAYAAADDVRNALPEYVRAADLLPENVELQIKAGNLLLLGGRFQDAKTRARTVLKRQPKDLRALVLLGNALAGLRELADAVAVAERASELSPNRAGIYTNLGALRLANGDRELAEEAFKKAVAIGGTTLSPRLALSNFYRACGRVADAERALREALAIVPRDADVNRRLGALLIEASRGGEAEPYFKTAAAVLTDTPSQLALADYYITVGRPADALAVLTRVASDPKTLVIAKTRMAVVQMGSGLHAEAYKTIDEILAKSPKDSAVMALKAQLLLADYRLDEALAMVKAAVTLDPRSGTVQLTRGRVLRARGELEDARKALNEALDLDRLGVGLDAAIELANLHMQRREMDTSIAFAERGVNARPDSLDARMTLIRTLMVRSEDYPRAENEVKTLLARYPAQPAVHAAWGNICIVNRDPAGARRSYERALQLDPDSVEAWNGLMVLDASGNTLPALKKRLEARIAGSSRKAELLMLNAKVAVLSRDVSGAEQNLKHAVQADPAQPDGYALLGQLYVTQRKLPAATDEFLKMAGLDQTSVPAATMLGLLYSAQNNVAEAEKWYERAVQIDPRGAAAASNNLAWMYAERGGNLETATRLAQYAKSQAPDQPQFNDTLGWIYYKREMSTQAISTLQAAVDAAPNEPEFHFHLGLAYAQAGNDSKARKALERALKLSPRFPGADEARKALASLVY
jgi:tetratricopeptide (TPR) repeat protein